MFGVCLGYANNRDDAKDILQDGFVKVFSSLKNYGANGSLEGWIRRIIVNTCIDYYRKTLKEMDYSSIDDVGFLEASSSALEMIYAKELQALIHNLPDGARIIFNMYVVEGYSHNEIAEMLNVSEGTSKSQFSRAKTLLQKMIGELYPERLKKQVILSEINT